MSDGRPDTEATVLLAEDSAVVRAVVRKVLEAANYCVVEASNGEEAFELFRKSLPDIALLDVEMPVLDGRELLARLKSDPALADVPVIFLTGQTSTNDIVRGLELGAHDYLHKPFEPPELIARVAAAVRVAKLQQQLSAQNAELSLLSRTDRLTGLANRRFCEERLDSEIEDARRYGQGLTLLMLDIDHFKHVNDTFGHAGGDVVLREVTRRLEGLLRAGDVAARWGGEEFLVILPNTSLDGGVTLGERFIATMRAMPIVTPDGRESAVTVSIGAATWRGESIDDFVRQADDALYRAKREGRDQLRVSDE